MDNTGRHDITSQAEEMSTVALSHNLTTVTTEIKAYQSIGGQAIFEIGRRLKWVKENDLAHGEFGKWLQNIEIQPRMAQRFIKVASDLELNATSMSHLGIAALYEIATMPETERDKPQQLDSGEVKKPDEMTVRELRETKRKLTAKIKQNKQVIQVAQAAIKTDNQKITMRQKDLKYETDSQRQDTLSGISDIRSDQDTQRTNISEAQKDIEKRQTEIAYMQKKQTAINDGSYQLPKPGKTQIYQK